MSEQKSENPLKKKSSLTIVLLGLTVVLLVCLIGYDIMKESWSPASYAEKKVKAKKPIKIISDNGDPQRNKKQSKYYQNSYPVKQSVSDLEKSIIANEFLHNKSHSTIRTLEKDLEIAQKKIDSFDYALDTLTSKIELTRAEKEKLESQYQEQLNQIQAQNRLEKDELKNSLQESASTQYLLKKQIEEKIAHINDMADQLSKQKENMELQTKEIAKLTEKLQSAHSSHEYEKAQAIYVKGELLKSQEQTREIMVDLAEFESELDAEIKQKKALRDQVAAQDMELSELKTGMHDLAHILEKEKNVSEELHHQLHIAFEKFEREKQMASRVQDQLQVALHQMQETEKKLNATATLSAAQEKEMKSYASSLLSLSDMFDSEHLVSDNALMKLENEQTRTELLQERLSIAREKTSELEAELAEQSIYYNRKEAHLTEGMQQLKLALLKEKVHVEELTENLKQVANNFNEERKKALDMQEVLVIAMEKSVQLEEELAYERSLLAVKENDLTEHRKSLGDEQLRNETIMTTLKESQTLLEAKEKFILHLEEMIGEEKQKITYLETQLGNQFAYIAQKEGDYEKTIKDLSENLESQKGRTLDLYTTLEETLKKYSSENDQVAELERRLTQKDQEVRCFESELVELRKLYVQKEQEMMKTIEELKLSLNAEESKSTDFSDALQDAVAQQFAEEQKAAELEFRLLNALERTSAMENTLKEQSQMLAQKEKAIQDKINFVEPEKVKQLETMLEKAMLQAKQYEAELLEKKGQIASKEAELQHSRQKMSEKLTVEKRRSKELKMKLGQVQERADKLEQALIDQRMLVAQKEVEIRDYRLGSADQLQREKEKAFELESHLLHAVEKAEVLSRELSEQHHLIEKQEQEMATAQRETTEILTKERAYAANLEEILSAVQDKVDLLEDQLFEQLTVVAEKDAAIKQGEERSLELENKTAALQSELLVQENIISSAEKKNIDLVNELFQEQQQKWQHLASVKELESELKFILTEREELDEQLSIELARSDILESQFLEEMDKVLAAHAEEKEQLGTHLLSLETELTKHRQLSQEQSETLASLKKRSTLLEEQSKEEKGSFLAQLAEFEEQKKTLSESLYQERIRTCDLAEKIELLARNEINQLQDSNLRKEKIRELEGTLSDLRLRIQSQEEKLANFQKHSGELEWQNAEYKMAVSSHAQELVKMNEMQAVLESLREYSASLESELREQSALAALKDQELKTAIQQSDIYRQQQESSFQELEEQRLLAHQMEQEWQQRLQDTTGTLQATANEKTSQLENAIEHVQMEMSSTLYRLAAVEEELKREKKKDEALVQELTQEKAYAATIYDTLKDTIAKLDAEESLAEKLEKELSESRKTIEQYAIANQQLKDSLDEVMTAVEFKLEEQTTLTSAE